MNVLLLDDDPMILRLQSEILEDYGPKLFLANTTSEAMDIVKEENIEAAIIDFKMAGENGLEFIERAKAFLRNTKVILCSAYLDNGLKDRAYELGVERCINKPFETKDIMEVLIGKGNFDLR